MKAAPFEYVRPKTLSEAAILLAAHEDARVIAGGQTLVPMMAMRLARPSLLVDIAHIPELAFIRDQGAFVGIGAMTRQAAAEKSQLVARHLPLLAAAMPWVGHAPTRNRGTIGGSIANADPAAEIPLVLVTLEGSVCWMSASGQGEIAAGELFSGPMATELPEGAILTEVQFPKWTGSFIGTGFHEASARRSDFAYVSAAAQVQLDERGLCLRCAIGIGGAMAFPRNLPLAGRALAGTKLTSGDVATALAAEITALEIMTDGHASAAYRRRVAAALAARAIADARDQALEARA